MKLQNRVPVCHHASEITGKIPTASDSGAGDSSSSSSSSPTKQKDTAPLSPGNGCPRYGCPLLPRDMYFDEEAQAALKAIRSLHEKYGSRASASSSPTTTATVNNNATMAKEASTQGTAGGEGAEQLPELNHSQALELLKSAGGQDQATLTLIGYKGGNIEDQINQDRAFVVSPFHIECDDSSDSDSSSSYDTPSGGITAKRILGVFDGHSNLGELVSQYAVTHLPEMLSSKLGPIISSSSSSTEESTQIQQALIETFVEIDKNAPAEPSGGCTASVVLQLGHKIYVANAGDSRSLIATYTKSTATVDIVYITREDKPDLPEERARVERMGGQVYIPPSDRDGASSRVLFVDKNTDRMNGLAMSRSIGDWDAGKLGVIPDPTVAVLDILDLIAGKSGTGLNDDVEVFAVSATDGLLDFVDIGNIATTVAHSLYVEEGPHPLSACESLITTAATLWWKAKNGTYRDDIAIAVSKLSL